MVKNYQQFYFKGFEEFALQSLNINSDLSKICTEIFEKPLRDGFIWSTKYQNTFDLRPNVYDYDSVFLDFLFVNQMPQKIEELSQRKLVLNHVQVRKSLPGPSYMDWHRDAYMYDSLVGNAPAAYKIIFYPLLGRQPEDRLHASVGSNVCMFTNRSLDAQILQILPRATIKSSDSSVLFFDTSLFHAVVPDTDPQGSLRLIYSFVTPDQYRDNYSSDPVHSEAYRRYMERL